MGDLWLRYLFLTSVIGSVSGILGSGSCTTLASTVEGFTDGVSTARASTVTGVGISISAVTGVCSNNTTSDSGACTSSGMGFATGSAFGSSLGVSTVGTAAGMDREIFSGAGAGAGGGALAAFFVVPAGGALTAIPRLAFTGGLAACCSSSALLWACCRAGKTQ